MTIYEPHFRRDKKNVPILSKDEINFFAERYVAEFQPDILCTPQPFDIEGFLEQYLKLTLDYQYLSHDGRYLGMTVFSNTDKVIVYQPERECAEYLRANHGTVIIDNTLLEMPLEHRYRFTLGHECGHWVFHRSFYGYDPYQLSLFDTDIPYLQCREVNACYLYDDTNGWDAERWMEWQADKFAAAILMPRTCIKTIFNSFPFPFSSASADAYRAVENVSATYNVSKQAAYLRLCDLEIIRKPDSALQYRQLSFL